MKQCRIVPTIEKHHQMYAYIAACCATMQAAQPALMLYSLLDAPSDVMASRSTALLPANCSLAWRPVQLSGKSSSLGLLGDPTGVPAAPTSELTVGLWLPAAGGLGSSAELAGVFKVDAAAAEMAACTNGPGR